MPSSVIVTGTTIYVAETRRSRGRTSSGSPTAKREYRCWGTSDGDKIEIAASSISPTTINGLVIDQVDCSPDEGDETVWDVLFSYGKSKDREVPQTNAEEISFELGSQTIRVKQSISNVARYAPSGKTATDFKGGIGYDTEKKSFEGADKFIEVFTFSITKYFPKATVEAALFIQNLRACAFKTNNNLFRGFAPGEVLFVGASGSKRSADDYAITFKFMVGLNASNITIGNINGISKNAWEYLWVLYQEVEDTTSNPKILKSEPLFAYREQMYLPANFPNLLGVAA